MEGRAYPALDERLGSGRAQLSVPIRQRQKDALLSRVLYGLGRAELVGRRLAQVFHGQRAIPANRER